MALTKVTYSMIDGISVNAVDYGADPTGVNDSTAAIQAACDYVNSLTDKRVLTGSTLNAVSAGYVYFPNGYYKISGTITVASNGYLALVGEESSVIYGTGTKSVKAFTSSAAWRVHVENLQFQNFNTVFEISTNNADISQWRFIKCVVQSVNCFVDSVSYDLSRSTQVVFDSCQCQYDVKQFAKLYCDHVNFKDCWLNHTVSGFPLIYGNSFFNLDNCMLIPVGSGANGNAWVYLTNDNGAGGTETDLTRGVVINACRVSNEGANPPLIVNDYPGTSSISPEGGPIISINNCVVTAYHPTQYEAGGTETGVVQLKQWPIQVTFVGCSFQAMGGATSYLVAKNSTLTGYAPDFFNVWLDDATLTNAMVDAQNYTVGSKIANSLDTYINNPQSSVYKDIGPCGYLLVSQTGGVLSSTFKIKTGYNANTYASPITFILVLSGQGNSVNNSYLYAGSTTYIVTISGYVESGTPKQRIDYTKLHGSTFGNYVTPSTADIVSFNFVSSSSNVTTTPLDIQQVRVTWGNACAVGKAKIINFIDKWGVYGEKPQG